MALELTGIRRLPGIHRGAHRSSSVGIAARVGALLSVVVTMVLVVALAVGATVSRISGAVQRYADVSIPPIPVGPQTTFVYDADGNQITALHAEVNRVIVPLQDISPTLRDAVVAIEDKGFYRHGGLDVPAIARAAWENTVNGRIEQGGSTITQQYVKNVFTGGERTFTRKIHEAILAMKLENQYSKDEILEKYLNTVYFGHGAYGAQAAALTYFGIPASKLRVHQAALLAGLIAAPGRWDPLREPDAALARRNTVLDRMAEQGYLTAAEATKYADRPIRLPGLKNPGTLYPYFVQDVTKQLLARDGYDRTFEGGLRVQTTLDPSMQVAAERAVAVHLPDRSDPSAALVAIEPSTGAIRAMVGGRDFEKRKFNLATQGHRQTGSAAKTFTLAAAVQKGISLNTIWRGPSTIVIPDKRCLGPDKDDPTKEVPWEVSNYADGEAGTFTLAQAIAHSVNTIFAQLVVDVGPDEVVRVMRDLGVRQSKLETVCSVTLGSQAITPVEMTSAYSTLAARGVYHPPVSITEIKTASGQVLEKASFQGERVMKQNDADVVTYALEGVIQSGPARRRTSAAPPRGRPGPGRSTATRGSVDTRRNSLPACGSVTARARSRCTTSRGTPMCLEDPFRRRSGTTSWRRRCMGGRSGTSPRRTCPGTTRNRSTASRTRRTSRSRCLPPSRRPTGRTSSRRRSHLRRRSRSPHRPATGRSANPTDRGVNRGRDRSRPRSSFVVRFASRRHFRPCGLARSTGPGPASSVRWLDSAGSSRQGEVVNPFAREGWLSSQSPRGSPAVCRSAGPPPFSRADILRPGGRIGKHLAAAKTVGYGDNRTGTAPLRGTARPTTRSSPILATLCPVVLVTQTLPAPTAMPLSSP
ncbi:MAG: transglycosylase domain-containing protein [Actinomycetota bacterium]